MSCASSSTAWGWAENEEDFGGRLSGAGVPKAFEGGGSVCLRQTRGHEGLLGWLGGDAKGGAQGRAARKAAFGAGCRGAALRPGTCKKHYFGTKGCNAADGGALVRNRNYFGADYTIIVLDHHLDDPPFDQLVDPLKEEARCLSMADLHFDKAGFPVASFT